MGVASLSKPASPCITLDKDKTYMAQDVCKLNATIIIMFCDVQLYFPRYSYVCNFCANQYMFMNSDYWGINRQGIGRDLQTGSIGKAAADNV